MAGQRYGLGPGAARPGSRKPKGRVFDPPLPYFFAGTGARPLVPFADALALAVASIISSGSGSSGASGAGPSSWPKIGSPFRASRASSSSMM